MTGIRSRAMTTPQRQKVGLEACSLMAWLHQGLTPRRDALRSALFGIAPIAAFACRDLNADCHSKGHLAARVRGPATGKTSGTLAG